MPYARRLAPALVAAALGLPAVPARAALPPCLAVTGAVGMPGWQIHLDHGLGAETGASEQQVTIDFQGSRYGTANGNTTSLHVACATASGTITFTGTLDSLYYSAANGSGTESLAEGMGAAVGPSAFGTGVTTVALAGGGGYDTAATVHVDDYFLVYGRSGVQASMQLALNGVTVDVDGPGPEAGFTVSQIYVMELTSVDDVRTDGYDGRLHSYGLVAQPGVPVVHVG
jgi:hypothetical protein